METSVSLGIAALTPLRRRACFSRDASLEQRHHQAGLRALPRNAWCPGLQGCSTHQAALSSQVSVTCNQLRSKNSKGEIPEINVS